MIQPYNLISLSFLLLINDAPLSLAIATVPRHSVASVMCGQAVVVSLLVGVAAAFYTLKKKIAQLRKIPVATARVMMYLY